MCQEAEGHEPGSHHVHTGRGDPAADERGALPGVFGKVSGERGGHFQGSHQKNFGLQSKTKELQEEEEMCSFVKSKVSGPPETKDALPPSVETADEQQSRKHVPAALTRT